jgi:hypothetical protein
MWEFSLASHLLFATDTAHEAKKSGAAVDFRVSERLANNSTTSYGAWC